MIFWEAFLHSVKLPNKKAVFKLNRTGMDIVVLYIFILLLIVSIPSLIDQLTTSSGPSVDMNIFFLVIYFFIFYYLTLTVLFFGLISLIAYIGKIIANLMQRKLRFSILWKMSAFATTVPFLIYTMIALVLHVSDTFLWLSLLYAFVLLIKIITIYPKRRKLT